MLPENITAVVSRNERWRGEAASEPYEAGWAREAIFFVRALKQPVGPAATAWIEISPDGMHWLREGTEFVMPAERDGMAMARLSHFGNWLRVAARFDSGAECSVLVTLHLKA
ncbi:MULTISPECIES: hypothetical protein [unclassified Mesorhizobium]|uniref:hypothetical protein n=1 Tax=unclassified Mesorhizobium TaxID=325217 RepID=UPI00112A2876|nr:MULTISPECIES: hypothetical protein [unclassified Mesorhizobium]TPJ47431.1 hypothetical protein FJ437_11120 [Mesorhizobium sp. B2-6-6]MBZ9699642.1 hypothetical protein [Mesorhizobium sp. CO1-1-3]MBZ9918632.1 hypothetical protein [Mesorhizobium sp. BR1-1-7]MBZ9945894.1 hypothetical protein [Mesorhizobium sp. BR1-1-11]MBZ9952126.1 hypothetical protein [Mesorhizobium sp. BR1-1-15]